MGLQEIGFELKFALRRVLLKFPRVYWRIAKIRSRPSTGFVSGAESVTKDTEVLITGLYRTGNSFAVNAFRMAQNRDIRIAHHEYPTPQIVAAADLGIPAVLLIRDPDEVAVSRVISHPPITLKHALVDYIQCYGGALPYKDHFIVADFAQVTGDFGEVTKRLNSRFGSTFVEFVHNEDNVNRAFGLIDDRYKAMSKEVEKSFGRVVARPSEERNRAKEGLQEELASDALRSLRLKARDVYEQLQALATM